MQDNGNSCDIALEQALSDFKVQYKSLITKKRKGQLHKLIV